MLLVQGKRRVAGAREEEPWEPVGQAVSLCPEGLSGLGVQWLALQVSDKSSGPSSPRKKCMCKPSFPYNFRDFMNPPKLIHGPPWTAGWESHSHSNRSHTV